MDGAAPRWWRDDHAWDDTVSVSRAAAPTIQYGCAGARDWLPPARHRRRLSAVRWHAGRGDRHTARDRRYADTHADEHDWPLGARPARRLRSLLPVRVGRDGTLDRAVDRPDLLRGRADRDVDRADAPP